MFLRLLKGFRYNSLPIYRFSTVNPQTCETLLKSLFSLQNGPRVDISAKAKSYLDQIIPQIHDLTNEQMINLAVFTANYQILDIQIAQHITRKFRDMLTNKSINLTEMSTLMQSLDIEWNEEDSKIIVDFINSSTKNFTPNNLSMLLNGLKNLKIDNKELNKTIENKALEFVPYMNIEQLEMACSGMISRNASDEYWKRVEKKLLANFLLLTPKSLNTFCTIFFEVKQGSQEFWKALNDAIEFSAENYENIKFFMTFLGISQKGTTDLWMKYEENFKKIINNVDNDELLSNIVFMHESKKGSNSFWYEVNRSLFHRLEKFDAETTYEYLIKLLPFEEFFITPQNWNIITRKINAQINELDPARKSYYEEIMNQMEMNEKSSSNKKHDDLEGLEEDEEEGEKKVKTEDKHKTKRESNREKIKTYKNLKKGTEENKENTRNLKAKDTKKTETKAEAGKRQKNKNGKRKEIKFVKKFAKNNNKKPKFQTGKKTVKKEIQHKQEKKVKNDKTKE